MNAKNKIRAKKKFGQNFLTNEDIAKKIVNSINVQKYNRILELGPGTGMLSKYLITVCDPILIEIDEEAVCYLKKHIPQINNIILADFLKIDLKPFLKKTNAIIGNFPYNISTQILFKILNYKNNIQTVVGMFQKEVAERICSKPKSKKYGIISVLIQAYYDAEILFNVEKENFFPQPKVESSIIKLTRNNVKQLSCDEELFKILVKTSFNQRRKKLKNALKTKIIDFEKIDLDLLNKRAEELSVNNFITLTNLVCTNES